MAERAVDTHAIGDLVHGSHRKAAKTISGGQESSGRRKTSRYFATKADKSKDEQEVEKTVAKRKPQESSKALDDDVKPPPLKKFQMAKEEENADSKPPPMKKLPKAKKEKQKEEENDDDVFEPCPAKKLKSVPRKGVKKSIEIDENDEGNDEVGGTPRKPAGRGGGGRSSAAAPAGGRGGFMNFGERRDHPVKGEKEEGAPDCLVGKTFVISGTLDSLEREEAEDLVKRHGGRVTGSVSNKTNYLLADEDIGEQKSEKAKELGFVTAFLTEDGLLDLIHKSKPTKTPPQDLKNTQDKGATSQPKGSPLKVVKGNEVSLSLEKKTPPKVSAQRVSPAKRRTQAGGDSSLTWPEKYKPKSPDDILGDQPLLHEWLSHWNDHFLHTGQQGKGKKQNDNGAKKAVLISGSPDIGKSTSAKLVSEKLGFQGIEVNASDSRGKADSKILKGIGGSMSNSIKELVSNESFSANTKFPCALTWEKQKDLTM
ncbi:hypothetical protein C5167_004930 [Papaver somniferum]|uniref:BRCT domain-containing protein n=1 Tax=Papaver somniferum TaxID=3469 RepID=A0A4Y7J9X8_PAPSO|nr:hypothetical protein C5167_004930 [Papaver somniferum]